MPRKGKVFSITGDVEFGPFYPPDRIQITKERNLNRKENMCKGEDVTDEGAKNRDIHVSGVIRKSELSAFNKLLEQDEPLDLFTDAWSGEIHVRQGEVEGPTIWDSKHNEWLFEYRADFVSTGREEGGVGNGIVENGETMWTSSGGMYIE